MNPEDLPFTRKGQVIVSTGANSYKAVGPGEDGQVLTFSGGDLVTGAGVGGGSADLVTNTSAIPGATVQDALNTLYTSTISLNAAISARLQGTIVNAGSGQVLQVSVGGVPHYIPIYPVGLQPPLTTVLWRMWIPDGNGNNPLEVSGGPVYQIENIGYSDERTLVLTHEDAPPNAYFFKAGPGAYFQFTTAGTYLASGMITATDFGSNGSNGGHIRFRFNEELVGTTVVIPGLGGSYSQAGVVPYSVQFMASPGDTVRVTLDPNHVSFKYTTGPENFSALTLSVVTV